MKKRYKIGIIGGGFVGKALANGFALKADVRIYDLKQELSTGSFNEVINSDFIYICLPTPMRNVEGGEIDLSIIEETLKKIDKNVKRKTIVIKSTVVPGTTDSFANKYKNNYFLVNPEFLTARNANLDFIQASRIIVGTPEKTPRKITEKFIELQRERFLATPIVDTDARTAEFIKYMANCYFAIKITYMNEMHQLGKKLNVNWKKAVEGFLLDGRIGNSHYEVPGWDNLLGFGGACFPKDLNALIHRAKEAGFDSELLRTVWKRNKDFRSRKDWDWANNKSAVSKKETIKR